MAWIPDRYRELRSALLGDDAAVDIEEEFRLHLELRTEENIARGMRPDAAREEAARRFGAVDRWTNEMRHVEATMREQRRRRERLDSIRREVGQAARGLWHRPGYTILALVTLALGIGATTAGFTVLDAVVLRPLPYAQADRLVWLDSPVPGQGADAAWGLSQAGYFQFKEEATTLEEIGGFGVVGISVTGDVGAFRVRAASVQADLLDALSARPVLGRLIEDPDDDPMAPGAVVLGHGFWQREFGGDPAVVGRTLRIEGDPREVIGVMAPGFQLPHVEVDVWVPLQLDPAQPPQNAHFLQAVGLLRGGASLEAAQAELDRITARFPELFPQAYPPEFMREYGFRTRVRPLAQHVVGPEVTRSLWIVVAAVALVLLIACANMANLLLARTEGRGRELAVRAALGAGRSRLAAHAMAESLLLAVAAAGLGLILAQGALRALVALAPPGLPRLSEIGLGWSSLGFAAVLAALVGLAFGVLPVLGRPVRYSALREGGRGLTAGRSRHRARRAIVVAQVALALVLLAGAGLMLRSFQRLRSSDPGFEAERAVVFDLSLPIRSYPSYVAAADFVRRLTERLEALPGVLSAGAGEAAPLRGVSCAPVQGEAQSPDPGGSPPCTYKQQVSPGYFSALGIQLRGDEPTWTGLDAGAGEAVITEALARRLWPGQDAIGKGVRGSGTDWYRVVGVTGPLRAEALDAGPTEAVFYPLVAIEKARLWGPVRRPAVVLRTEGPPALEALVPAIRTILTDLDPDVPLGTVETLENQVAASPSMARRSFMMTLMGVAGGMALLLSVVGIYGVVSYVVGQRTGEMGVRMALGAKAGQVATLVVRDALILAGAGVVLGLLGAVATTRALQSLLYDVSAVDPLTLGGVALLLLLLAAAASWAPTRRATRVNPVEALRAE